MWRLAILLTLLCCSMAMTRSEPAIRARAESISRVVATPIPLDPAGGRTRVGALAYLEGWVLQSADPRFGGISAMARTPAGLVALSDSGTVMHLTPARAPSSVRLVPLVAGPGDSDQKADRDSEALAFDGAGRAWISFEYHNSVWRYAPGFTRATRDRKPPEMKRWRSNSGAEAMVRLADGRFLIFSESRGRVAESSEVLLFDRDPTDPRARAVKMGYKLPKGFSVTDAAVLDDGHIVTLHRSFSLTDGIAASVGIVSLKAMKAGAVLTPRILVTMRPPLNIDNMEALAIERCGPRTCLWMASDDNFSGLQRTLLLRFRMDG